MAAEWPHDDDTMAGQLDVFRFDHLFAELVMVGEVPDADEMWGSLGAWENPESELIDTLGLWLAQHDKAPGAYRIVCTDRHGETCTVDLIHGVAGMRT